MLWPPTLIAVALAALRVAGSKGEAFQAVAHLYVGFLVGMALGEDDRRPLRVALALSAVELAVFLWGRFA